ncbi:hypothetical protein EVAR_37250_1 [Eumeta japonica]|uniref:Uncharacterized protein n=1 Tax=Eumeta variegata TaxID=151549 RepID=A0A4C1Y9M8_EUMVA|nr:hypothetical protein EVAR_37250_1 [Eumeta japonica]
MKQSIARYLFTGTLVETEESKERTDTTYARYCYLSSLTALNVTKLPDQQSARVAKPRAVEVVRRTAFHCVERRPGKDCKPPSAAGGQGTYITYIAIYRWRLMADLCPVAETNDQNNTSNRVTAPGGLFASNPTTKLHGARASWRRRRRRAPAAFAVTFPTDGAAALARRCPPRAAPA